MTRRLTDEGEELASQFFWDYRYGNCFCHISSPCGSCTHPGNPRNLEACDDMWEEDMLDFAQMEAEARARLEQALQEDVDNHLHFMRLNSITCNIQRGVSGWPNSRRFRNSLNFGAPYGNT